MLIRWLFVLGVVWTTFLHAAGCTNPTATLTLDDTLNNQLIDSPYLEDDPDSGEALYYKIVIDESGTFQIQTQQDSANSDDTVDTYGELLDENCALLYTDTEINETPRYFTINRHLEAGTYYLRVYNEVSLDDSDTTLAKGYFQLQNSFESDSSQKNVSFWRDNPSSVESGEDVVFTVNVKNNGTVSTSAVKVTVPDFSENLTYAGVENADGWNCTHDSELVCTLSDGVLAEGESSTFDIRYTSSATSDDLTLTNKALMHVDYSDGDALDKTNTRSVTLTKQYAQIAIVKKATPVNDDTTISSVIEGDTFDFLLTISNEGTVDLVSVSVEDSVPSAFSVDSLLYDSDDFDCSGTSGQDIDCDMKPVLKPGEEKSLRIRVKATGSEGATNSASASGSSSLDEVKATDDHYVDIEAKTYTLSLDKTIDDSTTIQNHSTNYNLKITNTGNMPLHNVLLDDTVPSEYKLVSIDDQSGWNCDDSDISANHVSCVMTSDLDPGNIQRLTLNVQAQTIASDIVNSAKVDADNADTATASVTSEIIAPTPSISIDKSAPSSVETREKFYYTFSVKNDGTEILDDIKITDSFDDQLYLDEDWADAVASSWSCTRSDQTVTCTYANKLSSGETADTLRIKVQAPYTTSDITIDNSVQVDATSDAGDVSATDTAQVAISKVQKGVSVLKKVDKSSVESGGTFTYTLEVGNTGNIEQGTVTIADNIPSIFSDFLVKPNGMDCSYSDEHYVECTTGPLAPGEKVSFTIDVTAPVVTSDTTVHNDANVSAHLYIKDELDEYLTSNGGVDITILAAESKLSITKKASKTTVMEKESFVYTIDVANNGVAAETNVTVTDEIPSEFTISSVSAEGWSCLTEDQKIACLLETLPAGESANTITINVEAPETIENDITVTNTATVSSDQNGDGVQDSADVKLLSDYSALEIDLVSDPANVYTGDSYTYRFVVTNNSDDKIDGISFSDTLPDDVTFDSFDASEWDCQYNEDNRTFSCDSADKGLEPGEITILLDVKAPGYEANITNSVTMQASISSHEYNATAKTFVEERDPHLIFTEAKVLQDPVKMNDLYTYRFSVKNLADTRQSDINATDLNLTIVLDANETYQETRANGWNCSGTGTVICTLDYLAQGETSPALEIDVISPTYGERITKASVQAKESSSETNTTVSTYVKEIVSADLVLAVSDDPDPIESESIYTYDFTITNTHPTKAVEALEIDINTTSDENFDMQDYEDSDVWSCTQTGDYVHCKLDGSIAPNSDMHLLINAESPAIATDVNITATLYSEYLDELNPSDNTVHESTKILKTDLTEDHIRDFTRVPIQGEQDTNIYGDIISIGNQVVCEQNSDGNCIEPTYKVNDLIEQENINLDNVHAYIYNNATSARLNLQPGDQVIWAGLYWMGRIDKTQSGATQKMKDAATVYLRHESETLYERVTSERGAEAIDNDGNIITGVDKFNYINDDTYFDYQGMADVTSYVKAHKGGDYWVADVQVSEGDNISAGWNLVVIVMDTAEIPTRDLRNITVFDGFQGVWKSPPGYTDKYPDEVSQTVSGFITPAYGAIDSKLYMFAFEGDATLDDYIKLTDKEGNTHFLTDTANPSDDVVNGTVAENGSINLSRAPALHNTSGIDIDTFYVGDDLNGSAIIQNDQRSTTITIGSGDGVSSDGGDRFFLGMFAFSTNLHQPLCYLQSYMTADYSAELSDEVMMGETIGIQVEIRNKETQDVVNMHVYTQINPILSEDNSSYEIRNIDSSGNLDSAYHSADDLFDTAKIPLSEDENQTEITLRAGAGADNDKGGTLYGEKHIHFRYRARIENMNDQNQSVTVYKVSYEPTNKKIMLPPCEEQKNFPVIKINQTNGFNVLRKNALTDNVIDGFTNGDTSQPNNEKHLFTQVTGTPFEVDVVALDDTNPSYLHTDPYKGVLELELVEYNASKSCDTYTSLKKEDVTFDDTLIQSKVFDFDHAQKTALFRVRYLVDKYGNMLEWDNNILTLSNLSSILQSSGRSGICENECLGASANADVCKACLFKRIDEGGLARLSCSSDTFVIRPKTVYLDINTTDTHLIGARNYDLELDANTTTYDPSIDNAGGSLTATLQVPAGCAVSASTTNLLTTSLDFVAGKAVLDNFNYPNVGRVNVSYTDHIWTYYDQNTTDLNMSDCIIGSSSNTPDSSGRVGCNIAGSKLFRFVPKTFQSNASFTAPTGGYVYFSNDLTMSGKLNLSFTAQLDDGNTATNYSAGCFANDLNLTINVLNDPEDWNGRGDVNTSVHFGGDGNKTVVQTANMFKVPQAVFSNGVSVSVPVSINYARLRTVPQDPVTVHKNDFNTSVVDTDGVTGGDFNKATDQTIPYYYARVYATSIHTDEDTYDVPLYYEAYCKDGNISKYFPTGTKESLDSIHWYNINTIHTSATQGQVLNAVSKNGVHIDAISLYTLTISLAGIQPPHLDTILMTPDSWLQYNNYSETRTTSRFNVKFFPKIDKWGGQGNVGNTVDLNISTHTGQQIEW